MNPWYVEVVVFLVPIAAVLLMEGTAQILDQWSRYRMRHHKH